MVSYSVHTERECKHSSAVLTPHDAMGRGSGGGAPLSALRIRPASASLCNPALAPGERNIKKSNDKTVDIEEIKFLTIEKKIYIYSCIV